MLFHYYEQIPVLLCYITYLSSIGHKVITQVLIVSAAVPLYINLKEKSVKLPPPPPPPPGGCCFVVTNKFPLNKTVFFLLPVSVMQPVLFFTQHFR